MYLLLSTKVVQNYLICYISHKFSESNFKGNKYICFQHLLHKLRSLHSEML